MSFNSSCFERLGVFPAALFPSFQHSCAIETGYTVQAVPVAGSVHEVAVYARLNWPKSHRVRIGYYFRGWRHCRLAWESSARSEKEQSFREAVGVESGVA